MADCCHEWTKFCEAAPFPEKCGTINARILNDYDRLINMNSLKAESQLSFPRKAAMPRPNKSKI